MMVLPLAVGYRSREAVPLPLVPEMEGSLYEGFCPHAHGDGLQRALYDVGVVESGSYGAHCQTFSGWRAPLWLCPRAWLGAPYERLLSARVAAVPVCVASPLSPWQRLVTLSSPYTYVRFRSHQG
jgi:hypothetical protein